MNNRAKQTDAQPVNQKKTFNLSTKIDKTDAFPSNLNSNSLNFNRTKSSITTNHKTSNFLSSKPSTHSSTNSTSINSINVVPNSKLNQNKSATSSNYRCPLCGDNNFHDIERFNSHLIEKHQLDKRVNSMQCYVNGCEKKCKKRMELVTHLNSVHNLKIVVLTKIMDNLEGKLSLNSWIL